MEETRIRMIEGIFYTIIIITLILTAFGIINQGYTVYECNHPIACDFTNYSFNSNVEHAKPYNHSLPVMSNEQTVIYQNNKISSVRLSDNTFIEPILVISLYDGRILKPQELLVVARREAEKNTRILIVFFFLSIITLVSYILFLHTPSSWLKED